MAHTPESWELRGQHQGTYALMAETVVRAQRALLELVVGQAEESQLTLLLEVGQVVVEVEVVALWYWVEREAEVQ